MLGILVAELGGHAQLHRKAVLRRQHLAVDARCTFSGPSQASVDQIATEVGYAEGVTLRALLRRRLGRGVREIRRSL